MSKIFMAVLQVNSVAQLTPRMTRVTLGGEELADFPRPSRPTQHLRLLFPPEGHEKPVLPAQTESGIVFPEDAPIPTGRSVTLRHFDPHALELDVDIVLHGDTPLTSWARSVEEGDYAGIAGPGGGYEPPADADVHLLAGDETALPAIATILEELPENARARVFVEVSDRREEQPLASAAEVETTWLHRGAADPGSSILLPVAVRRFQWPAGKVRAWVGGEVGVVRQLRRYLRNERGLDRKSCYAAGYWLSGNSNEQYDTKGSALMQTAKERGIELKTTQDVFELAFALDEDSSQSADRPQE